VAEVGSVEVTRLFELERYPTLWQMTSTVTARSRAPLSELLAALFPCASVTGAPKRRTMQILAEHELAPRGLYTGTIGWAAPSGDAGFSVAIRTAVVDRERGTLRYGVGSGVVADSRAEDEYAECLLKARVLGEAPFALVETLAFLPGEGLRQLERHLRRLAASAEYFGFRCERAAVGRALADAVAGATGGRRVRLLLHADGRTEVELAALPAPRARPVRVGLAARAVDSASPWLYHKTTRREVYDEARASRPDCEEVLLWNERAELTEGSIANLVVEREGRRITPALACGLLPGIERARLLESGQLSEGLIHVGELSAASRLWLVSALRGERAAVFVG
jgi:para-aminobenzoate synthetase/4-amino-4-deoxychorismate lyase